MHMLDSKGNTKEWNLLSKKGTYVTLYYYYFSHQSVHEYTVQFSRKLHDVHNKLNAEAGMRIQVAPINPDIKEICKVS